MKPFAPAWLIGVLVASTALAQDAPTDWEIDHDPAKRSVVATVVFDSGIVIGVRCVRGALGVVLGGLPPATGATRPLRISYGDQPMRNEVWVPTTNPSVAVHHYPASVARRLRLGGPMNIVVPGAGEGGRNLRYVLDLPASATAIEQVLTACNRPLVDPRDALLDENPTGELRGLRWVRRPHADYPEEAIQNGIGGGYAVLSCVSQRDGSLTACEVESEHPLGSGFGRASLDSLRRARVGAPEGSDGPVPIQHFQFSVRYTLAD